MEGDRRVEQAMYRSALVACSILKPCSAGAFAPLRQQLRWNGGTGNDGRGGTARRLLVLLARRRGLCGLFFFGCLVEATSPLRRNNLRETASVRDRSRPSALQFLFGASDRKKIWSRANTGSQKLLQYYYENRCGRTTNNPLPELPCKAQRPGEMACPRPLVDRVLARWGALCVQGQLTLLAQVALIIPAVEPLVD